MILSRRKHGAPPSPFLLNGQPVDFVDSIRYLGLTISTDLSWSKHIKNIMYLQSKPTSCLALEVMFLICLDQETSAEMVSLKYLILSTKSTGWPFRSKGLGFATCFLLDRIMALHFRGLKRRLTELAQRPNDVAIVSSSSHADKISIIGIHNKFWVCSQWPNTDPWGRPDIIGEKFKHVQLTTTCWFRPVRQLATHLTC